MKRRLLLPVLLMSALAARAQQPTIDPGFVPTRCYAPAPARQAVQQPDGKIVAVGDWLRAEGSPAGPVVRYLAGGTQPDASFNANCRGLTSLGSPSQVELVVPLASGKLLVINRFGFSMTLGSVTRQMVLRLNADGTPDASFDAGAAVTSYFTRSVHKVLEQPDGKLLVAGAFQGSGGQSASEQLLRLNPDGSRDTAFSTALASVSFDPTYGALDLALQADGRILVSAVGAVMSAAPTRHHTLVRLLATGAYDTSFDDRAGQYAAVTNIALQPDGKILAALFNTISPTTDSLGGQPAQRLVRLDASGLRDASFQLDAQVPFSGSLGRSWEATRTIMQVQPDGRVLLNGRYRLLGSGTRDASFAPDTTAFNTGFPAGYETYFPFMQLLTSGKVLVGGWLKHYAGFSSAYQGVALLNADGTRDAGFIPNLQTTGRLAAVLRQPDGKLLVGGFFDELNGQRIANVGRLNSDGSLDAAFSPAAINEEVTTMALQADGRLLLGGYFQQVGNSARVGLARLLPAGGLDAAFAPALAPPTGAAPLYSRGALVQRVLALPSGQVLVTGGFSAGSGYGKVVRLSGATGQVDAGFQLPASVAATIREAGDAVLLPNGNVVAIVYPSNPADSTKVVRLLPSGVPDPTFAYTAAAPNAFDNSLLCLAVDAAGRLYISGVSYSFEFGNGILAQRLLANGRLDNSFYSRYYGAGGPTGAYRAQVNKLVVQPNGRLLLGGTFSLPIHTTNPTLPALGRGGTCRVLGSGALDTAYDPTRGPGIDVVDMLLEPDGAIVVAGSFRESFSGQTYHGLMRLRDANVLAVSSAQLAGPATAAWPVPAHGELHVALEAAAHPQRVQLLDALGRAVLTQPTAGPDLTLDVAALPAGAYVLRVDYAAGPVARRVVLE